jgi:hypothetical protein
MLKEKYNKENLKKILKDDYKEETNQVVTALISLKKLNKEILLTVEGTDEVKHCTLPGGHLNKEDLDLNNKNNLDLNKKLALTRELTEELLLDNKYLLNLINNSNIETTFKYIDKTITCYYLECDFDLEFLTNLNKKIEENNKTVKFLEVFNIAVFTKESLALANKNKTNRVKCILTNKEYRIARRVFLALDNF